MKKYLLLTSIIYFISYFLFSWCYHGGYQNGYQKGYGEGVVFEQDIMNTRYTENIVYPGIFRAFTSSSNCPDFEESSKEKAQILANEFGCPVYYRN